MKREAFIQDVDDVLFGSRTVGTLGRERIDITIDSGQFIFNGLKLIQALIQMLDQDVDGMPDLVDFLVDFISLNGERLLEADVVEGVAADGISLRREKKIPLLSMCLERDGC